MAERGGFEPPIRYKRIHTFQACAFDHSATSPIYCLTANPTTQCKHNQSVWVPRTRERYLSLQGAEHKPTIAVFQMLIARLIASRYSWQMPKRDQPRKSIPSRWAWLKTHTELLLISLLVITALFQYFFRPQAQTFQEMLNSGVLRVLISNEPDSQYAFNQQHFGFEYELLEGFAEEHSVELQLTIVPYAELYARLKSGQGDVAVGGIVDTPFVHRVSEPTIPWFKARTTVVYLRGTPKPNSLEELANASVKASSRYYSLEQLDELNLVDDHRSEYALLSAVASGQERYALTTNYRALAAKHYLPELNRSFLLPDSVNLVWALPQRSDKSLLDALNDFLAEALEAGRPRELADRYFAKPARLNRFDALAIHQRIETELPKFEYAFRRAARRGNVDWHLLAALSYQESRWSNDAVSPTGVRGIMQLTQETAEYMGVSDRMDMDQSIDGAARYLKYLDDRLPSSIDQPERTWFALGAYNAGISHILAAYRKVREQGKDPRIWANIADVLPNLYGYPFSQGFQAVEYVERIQIFTDILRFQDTHLRDNVYFESLALTTLDTSAEPISETEYEDGSSMDQLYEDEAAL